MFEVIPRLPTLIREKPLPAVEQSNCSTAGRRGNTLGGTKEGDASNVTSMT